MTRRSLVGIGCCACCKKPGHGPSVCPVNNLHKTDTRYNALANRQCFMRAYRGHTADTSPANSYFNLGWMTGQCYICGDPSHKKRSCPETHKYDPVGPWRKEVEEIVSKQAAGTINCHRYWVKVEVNSEFFIEKVTVIRHSEL